MYTTYTGSGGIPIAPLLNRLAFSVKFGTIKFFFTSAIDEPEPHHHPQRHPATRISAAAPFLKLDHDPYMVIAGGKAVLDPGRLHHHRAATRTRTPQGGLNYIRNSVKIVVDAYNGTMKFYVFDPQDPMLQDLPGGFPVAVHAARARCRRTLLAHVRYPEDLFNTQAEVYSTYHVNNADAPLQQGRPVVDPDQRVALAAPGPWRPTT